MGRVVISLLVSVVMLLPMRARAESDWTAIVDLLEKSVMQISDNCSAFAINEARDLALTAEHCGSQDADKPTIVDLIPAVVVAKDVKRDLLVLYVPGMDRPALQLAKDDPPTGTEVVSYGYGGGYAQPMLRHAIVANREIEVTDLEGQWVALDGAFVGGQSGAPVVNVRGEVVAIVQRSSDRMGLGRSAETIRDRVGRFFAKATP